MPSDYDLEKRQISIETEFSDSPRLAAAALVQSVVHDLLFNNGLASSVPGEFLDAAVVLCGLGGLRAQVELMNDTGSYWDTTHWNARPIDFLDHESLTYAHSLAAWCRGGSAANLPAEIRSAKTSLKYLNKTNDSFFTKNLVETNQLKIEDFVELAANGNESTRIAAMQFFHGDHPHLQTQDAAITKNLQHHSQHVVAHAASAAQATQSSDPEVVESLKRLTDNHDERLKSKAVQALTVMGQVDELVADNAAKMLSSSTNFVTYTGLFALSKLDRVSEDVLKLADRGFERALHTCNYQFVELFSEAYKRWLDDPAEHLNRRWGQRSPEYLQMALEAFANQTESSKQTS